MSSLGIIAQQADEVCEMCGKVDECRPYGPDDANICFDCATTKCDPKQVEMRMAKHIFGENK